MLQGKEGGVKTKPVFSIKRVLIALGIVLGIVLLYLFLGGNLWHRPQSYLWIVAISATIIFCFCAALYFTLNKKRVLVRKRIWFFSGLCFAGALAYLFVCGAYTSLPGGADGSRINIQMAKIRVAIDYYSALHHACRDNSCPASLDELLQFASTNEYMKKDAPLRKEDLIDRWGEPFGYERRANAHGYVLWSSGPDRKMGTMDDVVEGWPRSYVASWKSMQTSPVDGQETNAVQREELE